MNSGENVDDQEYFGFTGSYFKIYPTNIDDHTIFLNMQLDILSAHRNIENNEKQYYVIYD